MFTSKNNRAVALSRVVSSGLSELDSLRKYMERYNLEVESMREIVEEKECDVLVEVDEAYARKTGRFELSGNVRVEVPDGALNDFTERMVRFRAVGSEKNKVECWRERVVNKKHLLENWEKAGFPLIWEMPVLSY